jgi:hypothetical protein
MLLQMDAVLTDCRVTMDPLESPTDRSIFKKRESPSQTQTA